jgi:hypothetical protein
VFVNATQTSPAPSPTTALLTSTAADSVVGTVPAGLYALLTFVCAASNPRIASFELDGGVALVRLSNGVEFDAVVEFGSHTDFLLVSNEAGRRWLKRNQRVLAHEVDRLTWRERFGQDIGGCLEVV